MNLKKTYSSDVVIIGGGPGGIFAALELSKNNINTILIEKQSRLGGTALRFDVNLDYFRGLPLKSPLGKQVFGSRQIANTLIHYVYKILQDAGLSILRNLEDVENKLPSYLLQSKNIEYVDSGIIPVNKYIVDCILNTFKENLTTNRNLKLFFNTEIENIYKGKHKGWRVLGKNQNNLIKIETDNVIIATGKASIKWVAEILESLKILCLNNSQVDIGVRIEGLSKYFTPLTKNCLNPKIIIKHKNILIRTFCWCIGGKVIEYEFCDAKILDGQHSYSNPTLNTNFGIVSTILLPPHTSNTNFGINFAKLINTLGGGKITLQLLRDFMKNRQTTLNELKANIVKPTLNNFNLTNIRPFFPTSVANGIVQIINIINKICDNLVTKNCLVYAPVIERIFPIIPLNHGMETSRKGIFLIGDCSGRATGIITAAAMGIAAARYITNLCQRRIVY